MIARNKTVTGINGEFAKTTDQSCLNRFITGVDWNAAEVLRELIPEYPEGKHPRRNLDRRIAAAEEKGG